MGIFAVRSTFALAFFAVQHEKNGHTPDNTHIIRDHHTLFGNSLFSFSYGRGLPDSHSCLFTSILRLLQHFHQILRSSVNKLIAENLATSLTEETGLCPPQYSVAGILPQYSDVVLTLLLVLALLLEHP